MSGRQPGAAHPAVREAVEAVVDVAGPHLRVGVPLGIGKPNALVNALYRRVVEDPGLRLTLFTALTLEPPSGRSELERRLVEPIRERLYGQWPELDYAASRRRGELPDRVQVREFYLPPGALLGNPAAQQGFTAMNYSAVADDLRRAELNVLAQLVAPEAEPALGDHRPTGTEPRLSLASNPDLTLDLLPWLTERRSRGQAVTVAQTSRRLPYMPGDAEVPVSAFDRVIDEPALDAPLFGAVNRPVETGEWLVGLWASALVRDGGTVQLGIGTLATAVCHLLTRRHQENDRYRELLGAAAAAGSAPETARAAATAIGGDGPFAEGLYANTEMLVEGLLELFRAGVLSRRVRGGAVEDPGVVAHAGFFFGSQSFYRGLRELPLEQRRSLAMTAISWTNTLAGDRDLKERQRRHARFLNETMMVTALGAAVSDGLEDGRTVSGVGGQQDFVGMAHRLPGGRSILLLNSTRGGGRRARSNVRWSYGHATIPRQWRDLVVTEYGVADLRGRSDREVVEAMLRITDARFQGDLVKRAQAAGKLPRGFRLDGRHRANRPERLEELLRPYRETGFCPEFPLGTDLEPIEVELGRALRAVDDLRQGGWRDRGSAAQLLRSLKAIPTAAAPHLERMGLERARSPSERLQRRAVVLGLIRAGLI